MSAVSNAREEVVFSPFETSLDVDCALLYMCVWLRVIVHVCLVTLVFSSTTRDKKKQTKTQQDIKMFYNLQIIINIFNVIYNIDIGVCYNLNLL